MADTRTANEKIRDRMLKRSIRVPHTSLAGRASKQLDGLFDKLAVQTANGLKRVKGRGRGVLGRRGVVQLHQRNRRLIRKEVGRIFERTILPGLLKIGEVESTWLQGMISRTLGVPITAADAAKLARGIKTGKMSLSSLAAWQRSLERSIADTVEKSVKAGLRSGLTGPQIGKSLKTGNKSPLRRAKAHIRAITIAGVTHARNQATKAVTSENEIIAREMWVSVLDEKTSLFCIGQDGKTHKVGEGPYPPAHPHCRSIRIPYVGRPPQIQSYRRWLAEQPASFQDSVLGPTRGDEFRRLVGKGVDPNRIRFANVKQLKPLRVGQFTRTNRNKTATGRTRHGIAS